MKDETLNNEQPYSKESENVGIDNSPTVYHFIASLVTTHQMSPEDWKLSKMSRKNWIRIIEQTDRHNDNLKSLATVLKEKFERLKKVGAVEDKQESQEELWEEAESRFIDWHIPEFDIKGLMQEFTITRKGVN